MPKYRLFRHTGVVDVSWTAINPFAQLLQPLTSWKNDSVKYVQKDNDA